MEQVAKHIWFSGRVQGVGFRYTAQRIASRCGLTGYVRNDHGGSVEMLAQGQPEDIADCIRDIKDTFGAYVRDVRENEVPLDPRYNSFEITF
jgi:acylphosphatase